MFTNFGVKNFHGYDYDYPRNFFNNEIFPDYGNYICGIAYSNLINFNCKILITGGTGLITAWLKL